MFMIMKRGKRRVVMSCKQVIHENGKVIHKRGKLFIKKFIKKHLHYHESCDIMGRLNFNRVVFYGVFGWSCAKLV